MNTMFPSRPFPHRRYMWAGVLLFWPLLIAFALWWARRPFSLITYLGWLFFGVMFIGGIWYTYRVWALERLAYSVNRDGVYIRWGGATFVLPMRYIEDVFHGLPQGEGPVPSRWMWPAIFTWFGEHGGKRWYIFASAPWSHVLFLCGQDVCVGLSPRDEAAFIRAVNERRQLGPNRDLSLGWRLPLVARWRIWQDSVALVAWASGIILLTLLWGEAAIRLDMPRILWMARLGSFVYLVDWILGIFLYRRERLAGVILWWGGSAVLALLLIGLWVMRV